MDSTKNERTLQEAARWHARLGAMDCTEADRAALRSWLQRDPSHAAAYELAGTVMHGVDRLAAASGRLKALADEAFAAYGPSVEQERSRQVRQRRWLVPVGLAASIAIGVLTLKFSNETASDIPAIAYETAAGEQRTVTLDDGSIVHLDIATRIAVRMSAPRREVELLSGRALFQVAHDASRPFSVTAAGARTTALGTRFQVQREAARVIVTLAEGSVAIDDVNDHGPTAAWREQLRPGEQLNIDATSAVRQRQLVDAQIATSWTLGRHVFRGTPLHEALDEVNRYAGRKVRLGDPALADLPVAGNFIAGDSDVVVAAFAAVLPLRVVASGDNEIILFRRYDTREH